MALSLDTWVMACWLISAIHKPMKMMPSAHLRAGWAQIEAIRQLQIPEQLQIRVGIATGLVVVGGLPGIGETQERDVAGETPNLAARLQALAKPDKVFIDPRTHGLGPLRVFMSSASFLRLARFRHGNGDRLLPAAHLLA